MGARGELGKIGVLGKIQWEIYRKILAKKSLSDLKINYNLTGKKSQTMTYPSVSFEFAQARSDLDKGLEWTISLQPALIFNTFLASRMIAFTRPRIEVGFNFFIWFLFVFCLGFQNIFDFITFTFNIFICFRVILLSWVS